MVLSSDNTGTCKGSITCGRSPRYFAAGCLLFNVRGFSQYGVLHPGHIFAGLDIFPNHLYEQRLHWNIVRLVIGFTLFSILGLLRIFPHIPIKLNTIYIYCFRNGKLILTHSYFFLLKIKYPLRKSFYIIRKRIVKYGNNRICTRATQTKKCIWIC